MTRPVLLFLSLFLMSGCSYVTEPDAGPKFTVEAGSYGGDWRLGIKEHCIWKIRGSGLGVREFKTPSSEACDNDLLIDLLTTYLKEKTDDPFQPDVLVVRPVPDARLQRGIDAPEARPEVHHSPSPLRGRSGGRPRAILEPRHHLPAWGLLGVGS